MKKSLQIILIISVFSSCADKGKSNEVQIEINEPSSISDSRPTFKIDTTQIDSIFYDTLNLDFYSDHGVDENFLFKTEYNSVRNGFYEVSVGLYDYHRIISTTNHQIDTVFNPSLNFADADEKNQNNSIFIVYEYLPNVKEIVRSAFWNHIKISEGSYKIDSIFYKGVEQMYTPKTSIVYKQANGWKNGEWNFWDAKGKKIRVDTWKMGSLIK